MTYGRVDPLRLRKIATIVRDRIADGSSILSTINPPPRPEPVPDGENSRWVWMNLRSAFTEAAGSRGYDSITALDNNRTSRERLEAADEVLGYFQGLVEARNAGATKHAPD